MNGKKESCGTCVDHCGWVWQGGLSLLQTENCKNLWFISLNSDAHLVGWGWGVSVVLSGIFIVGKVPTLPKCASTRVASILPAPELPQAFRHQPIEIFSAPTKQIVLAPSPPQGFQWFSLLLGSPPRFFQINNKYLKSLKNKIGVQSFLMRKNIVTIL